MLINNTDMSLQGPPVRQITAEILHHVNLHVESTCKSPCKSTCRIYMGNLLATIFLLHL